ncbi:hypothetical protein M9Y10_020640 [Tritrichomonas musculus]|uniref:Protein kinase domain-containing protein n=1 Tax=Tritrichomonas musculus TaxID=1915356 RepID=A0ABR2HE67_9EUKA
MSIEEIIGYNKKIQNELLQFIDSEDDDDKCFKILSQTLSQVDFSNDEDNFQYFINLLRNISDNHYRPPNFFTKLEKIFLLLKDDINKKDYSKKIFITFRCNMRTLLSLIKENIIEMTSLDFFDWDKNMIQYFLPEVKEFVEKSKNSHSPFSKEEEEKLLQQISVDLPANFYENRNNGQNDSYICTLIRNDLIDDFITYMHKTNTSVDSKITSSDFETNSFLKENKPSLIEYSAFFGSIQIFQYLRINNATMDPDLWLYAIHGRNAEIIHLLEEFHVFHSKSCLKESIKCHHNEIARYLKDNLQNEKGNEIEFALEFSNYEFFPNDFANAKSIFFYLIRFEYFHLAKLVLESLNIEAKVIFNMNDFEDKSRDYRMFSNNKVLMSKNTRKYYFLKIIKKRLNEYDLERLDIYLKDRYPSLLNLKGYSIGNRLRQNLLFDLCEKGTLENYLTKSKKYHKEEENLKLGTEDYIIILGIAFGLNHLHQKNIVVQFLNPNYILIDANCYPHLTKYLKKMSDNFIRGRSETSAIDICFFAPEVIIDFAEFAHSPPTNVYSFAMIIYYILTREMIFDYHMGEVALIECLLDENFVPKAALIKNETVAGFIEKCIDKDPSKRMSLSEMIDFITSQEFCSYFDSIDNEAVKVYLDLFGDEFNNLKLKF